MMMMLTMTMTMIIMMVMMMMVMVIVKRQQLVKSFFLSWFNMQYYVVADE